VPADLAPDERRAVLADVCFRLSVLAADSREALSWADRGLALGRADDVFTTNLLAARRKAISP
jgi:hypothetical protein